MVIPAVICRPHFFLLNWTPSAENCHKRHARNYKRVSAEQAFYQLRHEEEISLRIDLPCLGNNFSQLHVVFVAIKLQVMFLDLMQGMDITVQELRPLLYVHVY